MISIRFEVFVLLVVHMNSVALRSLVEDLRVGEGEGDSVLPGLFSGVNGH